MRVFPVKGREPAGRSPGSTTCWQLSEHWRGADTLRYTAAAQSTGTTHDIVHVFDADADSFDLHIAVAGFEGTFNTNVDHAIFDDDLGVYRLHRHARRLGLYLTRGACG